MLENYDLKKVTKMPPKKITLRPSADWRTDNLHELWANEDMGELIHADGSLHVFLQYCYLLRSVRHQFETDDSTTHFDGCCFFLRGGYFAFTYLNMTSSMALRATIFGGMNHGRHPKTEIPRYIGELRDKARNAGKKTVELVIVDEVKSGSGMGQVLRLIKNAMDARSQTTACDVRISFYAIRPGQAEQMTEKLRDTVKKWHGTHRTVGGQLCVEIRHFAGPLLGYDHDLLCGIRTQSKNSDEKEAYKLVKVSGGDVTLRCDSTDYPVIQAEIDKNCLVEFLSCCAVSWTCKPSSALSTTLAQNIEANGCFLCKELYMKAIGLP